MSLETAYVRPRPLRETDPQRYGEIIDWAAGRAIDRRPHVETDPGDALTAVTSLMEQRYDELITTEMGYALLAAAGMLPLAGPESE